MDRIVISDLLVRCIIGVNEDERKQKQDVLINLAVFADLARAGRSDRFDETIDYREIKKGVMTIAESSRHRLLEALAEAIADVCLDHPHVTGVQVRVDKPGALRFARSVGVEITRRKQGAP